MKTRDKIDLLVPCPDKNLLIYYSQGILAQQELNSVAAHLERCYRCLELLQTLDNDTDELIRELRRTSKCDLTTELQDDEEKTFINQQIDSISDWTATLTSIATKREKRTSEKSPSRVGPYDLLEPLGFGGMGRVYKARHRYLGKLAAVKLLSSRYAHSSGALARFQQEMKAIGQLDHPNIVKAHDANIEDVPYLAMEYIEGADLSRVLRHVGPLPVAEACECIRQTALALQHANEVGLVHRDIKPSNLMLTAAGVVKVLDLGLARIEGDEEVATGDTITGSGQLTRDGDIMGTMDYVAPEQLLNCKGVDIRADLYSLGCTLYHLLAGKPIYSSGDIEAKDIPSAHLLQQAPDIRTIRPEIPEDLAGILNQLLAKVPEQRFTSPAALAYELYPFTADAHLPGLLDKLPASDLRTKASSRPSSKRRSSPAPSDLSGRLTTKPVESPGAPKHLWLVLLFVGLALVLAGSAYLFLKMGTPPPQLVTKSNGDSEASLIKTVAIDHFRGGEDRWWGRIGVQSFAATTKDGVKVVADFRRPSYCYLILFHPDGQDQLCFPRNQEEAQKPRERLTFPAGSVFSMQGKPGMYTFALVTSQKPLPDYEVFKASSKFPWPRLQIPPEGVWTYDGRNFANLPEHPNAPNDPARQSPFQEVCRLLENRPETEALYCIAFPVELAKEQKVSPP